MKILVLLAALATIFFSGQTKAYTTQNIHAHNDYAQAEPFWNAYRNKVGSIEADVFFTADGQPLRVAHTIKELSNATPTLAELYLAPLAKCIKANNGTAYADTSLQLQLMIDLKTGANATLKALIKELNRYPALIQCSSLKVVVSGNRPSPDSFSFYPRYIWFDGNLLQQYDEAALHRIPMLSASFNSVCNWKGEGELSAIEMEKIKNLIMAGQKAGKKVRFWGTPDSPSAWQTMMQLGVDYLNTDKVTQLASQLRDQGKDR